MQVNFVTCLLVGSQITTYTWLQSSDDTVSDSSSRKADVPHSNATMLQPVTLITCLSTVRCWQKCTERNTIGHSILVYNFEQVRVIVGQLLFAFLCLPNF